MAKKYPNQVVFVTDEMQIADLTAAMDLVGVESRSEMVREALRDGLAPAVRRILREQKRAQARR